ncbi:hypothetical protein [Deminuibacter soli]|uniref:hypothetical protein n=1 Tax=Deminuibacter soli TaxID=2291815 RepID=UPI0011C1C20D|nr:hypothetical protein [Deminuibacter soli]
MALAAKATPYTHKTLPFMRVTVTVYLHKSFCILLSHTVQFSIVVSFGILVLVPFKEMRPASSGGAFCKKQRILEQA